MYKNDAVDSVKDSPKESGLAILFDSSFFQSLKNTATILAKDTAELVSKGILPDLCTGDKKADTVEERAHRAAEIIASDPTMSKQEDRDALTKLLREAKDDKCEAQLLRAINDELKKRGINEHLKISEQHIVNPRTDEHLYYETLDLVVPAPPQDGKARQTPPLSDHVVFLGVITSYTEGSAIPRNPK